MEQVQTVEFEKKYNSNGYILIFHDDHWILEHKYFIEQFIGRRLRKEEVIHHINGIKTDNRLQNLMLFKSQKEHASFHNKIKQFGLTNPIRLQIRERWLEFQSDSN